MAAEGTLCGFIFLDGRLVSGTLGATDLWEEEGRWGLSVGSGQAPPPQQTLPFTLGASVEMWTPLQRMMPPEI